MKPADGTGRHVLFLARSFKGNAAFAEARRLGWKPVLLTTEALLREPWDRDALEDVGAVSSLGDVAVVRNVVSYLARERDFGRIATVDDMGVELAAHLREFLCLPGLNESGARLFRDKLAMRERARSRGVRAPVHTATFRDAEVSRFLAEVPGPWLIKPRGEALSKGIQTHTTAEGLWAALRALGDARSDHLIERFVPGDVFHVDSVVDRGRVVFAEAHGYQTPLLEVSRSNGMMQTRTVPHGSALEETLLEANGAILAALGLERGVAHTEIIRGRDDGAAYFLESAARVGGAHIADLVEATTGVNLWREYARLELSEPGEAYEPPERRRSHGALLITFARAESPDFSGYQGPEIAWRLEGVPWQAAVVVRDDEHERLDALLGEVQRRFIRDFVPPASLGGLRRIGRCFGGVGGGW
jgi:biotin carboxylase